jgi:hypothetical protein
MHGTNTDPKGHA